MLWFLAWMIGNKAEFIWYNWNRTVYGSMRPLNEQSGSSGVLSDILKIQRAERERRIRCCRYGYVSTDRPRKETADDGQQVHQRLGPHHALSACSASWFWFPPCSITMKWYFAKIYLCCRSNSEISADKRRRNEESIRDIENGLNAQTTKIIQLQTAWQMTKSGHLYMVMQRSKEAKKNCVLFLYFSLT